MSKKVDRHFQLSEDLLLRLEEKKLGKFSTKTSALEYYLKKGMDLEDIETENHKLAHDVKVCIKKLSYIEKLLEQLFANKNFACNNNINKNMALKDFKVNIYKDKFND